MRNQPKDLTFTNGLAVPVKPEPSPTLVANIKEWDIQTDSVVATATIKVDAPMRRIVVSWGDGTINTLRQIPGTEAAASQQNPLPPNTYKLSHSYSAPDRNHRLLWR
jgi:hypothetical protein